MVKKIDTDHNAEGREALANDVSSAVEGDAETLSRIESILEKKREQQAHRMNPPLSGSKAA